MNSPKKIILALLLLTVALSTTHSTAAANPPLQNGGFESGSHHATAYWTPDGGPYFTEFGEIAPPKHYTAWWLEGFPGADGWLTGRPEVRVITTIPDPERVRSGEQAVQWFTFWRSHTGGLLQQVEVEEGHYYTFSIYAHSWFANCDHKPHYPLPLDYDCNTLILWAQNRLRVGIDPTGGTDPRASTVVWGPWQERYGSYGDEPLRTGRVLALETIVTVFFESRASHPLKHDDVYLDDAVLRDATYQTFLPIIRR